MSLSATRARALLSEITETQRLFLAFQNLLATPRGAPVCLAVMSASPGEGKTLAAAALACVAAQHHMRPVLAMDLNWYRPALHEHFEMERSFAVSQLVGPGALRRLARPSGIAGLDILPAPLPYDTEEQIVPSLGGLVAHLVQEARSSYATVVLDCHSVFPANRRMVDPVSVARMADGVVLMVLAGVTPKQDVKKTCVMLEMSGAGKIGVFLNQWKNTLG